MALFKILKGNEANLPTNKTEGYAYFTIDTNNFYIDTSNSQRKLLGIGKNTPEGGVVIGKSGENQALELFSVAEGQSTKASGESGAHAEGRATWAEGESSHAEGRDTHAEGFAAHAEGWGTVAKGNTSHVSGRYNIIDDTVTTANPKGTYAVIVGKGDSDTTRSNAYTLDWKGNGWFANSVSSGNDGESTLVQTPTKKNGQYETGWELKQKQLTHVKKYANQITEILGTVTKDGSGNITKIVLNSGAFNKGAVSLGGKSQAAGSRSHAEGSGTFAYGQNSHAEGGETFAYGASSHAEGYDTAALGLMGHAEGTGTLASGDYSHAEGENTEAIAQGAHSEGRATHAINKGSHAEGEGTHAEGSSSHSEGINTQAIGDYSHAEGHTTKALWPYSHTEGYYTQAGGYEYGSGAHAEGYRSTAYGDASHTEGVRCWTAPTAEGAHAEGYLTYAGGENSHAEGRQTRAGIFNEEGELTFLGGGKFAHAEGHKAKAQGEGSHAEGYDTTASGTQSHSEGYGAQAIGSYSHAEGYNAIANATASHAEGYSTQATGSYTHAEGYNTQAINDYAHAQGNGSIASGLASNATGWETQAIGNHSTSMGRGTVAGSHFSLARGRYNEIEALDQYGYGKYVDIVGWGSDENHRKNIYTLDTNGSAWFAGNIDARTINAYKINSSEISTDTIISDYASINNLSTVVLKTNSIRPLDGDYTTYVNDIGFYDGGTMFNVNGITGPGDVTSINGTDLGIYSTGSAVYTDCLKLRGGNVYVTGISTATSGTYYNGKSLSSGHIILEY